MLIRLLSGYENIGPLLISLGLGYIVLYFAKREEKSLKNLGWIIGIFIVIVSSLLVLGKLYRRIIFATAPSGCSQSQSQ